MKIYMAADAPSRTGLGTSELWSGEDRGLVACWERGREKAGEDPALAARAKDGELVSLPWRGGVEQELKGGTKYGTLRYLAMWQGLRGDALDIDTDAEPWIRCSRFGVEVTFTASAEKYGNA